MIQSHHILRRFDQYTESCDQPPMEFDQLWNVHLESF